MIKTNLAVLMAERGLKIADIYEATGISKTTLMAIADNTGKGIQYDTVDKLCNYLNVSPSEFFIYAPFLVNFSPAIFEDSDYLYNFLCTVKKGELESNYNVAVDYFDRTDPDIGEDLYDPYKDFSRFDFTVLLKIENEDDNGTFFDFYKSLPIQFQNTLKDSLFAKAVNDMNDKGTKYFSFDKNKNKTIFPLFSSYLNKKKNVSVLFALIQISGSNIYVAKKMSVKNGKIIYK